MTQTHMVRFFRVVQAYSDEYGDDPVNYKLSEGIGEWEEISDEDFSFIKQNMWRVKQNFPGDNLVLVELTPLGRVNEVVSSIKEIVEKERKYFEEAKIKEEEKKKKRALERELKKTKTREALYEQLKKEFENRD